jgi:hypothetical protein
LAYQFWSAFFVLETKTGNIERRCFIKSKKYSKLPIGSVGLTQVKFESRIEVKYLFDDNNLPIGTKVLFTVPLIRK